MEILMRVHYPFLLVLSAVLCAAAVSWAQPSNRINVPLVFRQDFEEGNNSGWESYPPFQDSAFDPDFKCSGQDNLPHSRYALTRTVQIGFHSAHEIGFIRKVKLSLTPQSTVSFSYRMSMYGDAHRMEAVLCGMDGRRYVHAIRVPKDDQWQSLRLPVTSFSAGGTSFPSGGEMEAFYVLVYIDRTNPDVAYRFALDNVAITGTAEAQFRIVSPPSTVLEHWAKTVLLKHYQAGRTFGLATVPPDGVTLASVRFSLTNPQGNVVVNRVPLSFRPDTHRWEHTSLYTFTDRDEKGRWTGRLWGEDGKGRQMETTFDVWLTDLPQPHPRLYFGAGNLDFFKQRSGEAKWKQWFDSVAATSLQLRTTANLGSVVFDTSSSQAGLTPEQRTLASLRRVDLSVYDTTYLIPTLSHYYGVMSPAMHMLYDNALLYAVRGDSAAGEFAKDALVAIAEWKSWTHPWFLARHQESYYPVGELGVRAAFCYDVVYSLLRPEERKQVQAGLLRNCIIPVYQEYVAGDRIPSSTSNWIANSISGALSCIIAVSGDSPEAGDYEPYFTGLLTKLEEHLRSTLDTSGAWGEGLGYQSFAYTNTLPTITALERVFHTDITPPALVRSYLYFLYGFTGSEVLDVGDSHAGLSTLSAFAWISSKTHDPVFQWLYNQSPRNQPLDFLFGRESGAATPPDALPPSRLFTEIGGAAFRSGWSPDDLVMNFRCGAFYNHQHFHQGSFQLSAFGETLVPEAGVVNYYSDPWYRPYYIQAVGHNTVLLDRNPGSQRSGDYLHFVRAADSLASMEEFISTEGYDAATGELHKLYRGNLKQFERTIVFMAPRYFLVFDRLRSSGAKHEYDWLLHFDERHDVTVEGNNITVRRGQASLLAKVLYPASPVIEMHGAPVRLGVPITLPGYLQVSNPQKSLAENFLVVLYPQKTGEVTTGGFTTEMANLSRTITPLEGRSYRGTRITRGVEDDEILFRTDDGGTMIDDGHLRTDGRVVACTREGRAPRLLAVHRATYVSCDSTGWNSPLRGVRGTARFTAVGVFRGAAIRWEIQAQEPLHFMLHSERRPTAVKHNGQRTTTFQWDERKHLADIAVSRGTSVIDVEY
jgi:hypothetical protein